MNFVQRFLYITCDLPSEIVFPIRTIKNWWVVRKYPPGTFIEDCKYSPCVILEISIDGDIWAYDLAEGHEGGCSLFNCGIVKLSTDEVSERLDYYKRNGKDAYRKHYGERWDKHVEIPGL